MIFCLPVEKIGEKGLNVSAALMLYVQILEVILCRVHKIC